MNKQDLALNNLQGLICHKTQPTNLPNNTLRGYCEFYEYSIHNDIEKTMLVLYSKKCSN